MIKSLWHSLSWRMLYFNADPVVWSIFYCLKATFWTLIILIITLIFGHCLHTTIYMFSQPSAVLDVTFSCKLHAMKVDHSECELILMPYDFRTWCFICECIFFLDKQYKRTELRVWTHTNLSIKDTPGLFKKSHSSSELILFHSFVWFCL